MKETPMTNADLIIAIHSKITHVGECWVYQTTAVSAAPAVYDGKRLHTVHRVLWEEQHGSLRRNQCLHQKCGTKHCVRPAHFVLTRRGAKWAGWIINEDKDK